MLVGILTLAFVAGSGCDRSHLTATYARSFHTTFAVQTVNPDRRGDAKTVMGLDSQEAAIIAGTYRKQLSPTSSEASNQAQLLTYSSRGGLREASVMPPPSVGP
jgi:hypothetical protein